MDDQNKNLIIATALSFLVILGWFLFFPPPEPETAEAPPTGQVSQTAPEASVPATAPSAGAGETGAGQGAAVQETIADAPRVAIDTPRLTGSISLLGGRIDDLSLKDYRETIDAGSPIVKMLKPVGDEGAYYALYGWAPGAGLTLDDVPGPNTEWRVASGGTLGIDAPVTLSWVNGKGLTFRREIAIDADYMFTVTQSVENASGATVGLAPYGILARHGEPANRKKFFILHEGVVAMADGELTETDYKKMPDFDFQAREGARAEVNQVQTNGWIGFTDHYWMTTLIPAPGSAFKQVAKYDDRRTSTRPKQCCRPKPWARASRRRSPRSSSPVPRNGKPSASTRTRASRGSSTASTGAGSSS